MEGDWIMSLPKRKRSITAMFAALTVTAVFGLSACSDDGKDGAAGADGVNGVNGVDGADGVNAVDTSVTLALLGRYQSGSFDESAAEIVDYDATLQRAYVVNAQSGGIDVLDASAPNLPILEESWDVAADVAAAIDGLEVAGLGAANSVAVSAGRVAVAIEASPKQSEGYVAFYTTAGLFQAALKVGALPDMLTFTPDGNKLVVANEGEPNGDYSVDPDGSVSIIDVSGALTALDASDVTAVTFDSLTREQMANAGVRISAKAASVAADLEPEYVTVSADSQTAFVALQENNALAIIDLGDNSLEGVAGLGYKDFSIPGNELDASNKDDVVNIRNWPVFGTYMPDAIANYQVSGITYLITANEGDGREYLTDQADAGSCTLAGGFDFDAGDCFHYLDEIRIKDLDSAQINIPNLTQFFTDVDDLQAQEKLGRLKVITDLGVECTDLADAEQLAATGQPGASCRYSSLHAFGGRSFTIWNSDTGEAVFDSGSQLEVLTANRYGYQHFNASNDGSEGDDRSDDKGPEPEGLTIGMVGGKHYLFVGLERVGGVAVYNVSNPQAPLFVQYINSRDFTVDQQSSAAGDLGPEGLKFVPAAQSPIGSAMLIVGNEVSGTTTFYSVEEIGLD
jgi:hypothetical protein